MSGAQLHWKGNEVYSERMACLADAMGEIGLRVEGGGKRELYKGHGVITGTLRRSIHSAAPTYTWASDNVKPSSGSPERGGQPFLPGVKGDEITVSVGSGMEYAMIVHNLYHYMTRSLDIVKTQISSIVKGYMRD